MSGDIFTDFARKPCSRAHSSSAGASLSTARNYYEASSSLVPHSPKTQRFVDAMNAERSGREEAEMNTPEFRQKAAEAEMAERERKRIDFHLKRAIPRFLAEGWKHIRQDFVDEEIRVYTLSNERRRFWGIKPAGVGMLDFWEANDPEVGRYDDRIAVTWANALIPPPVTEIPVIWAGQGRNPDSTTPEPPIAEDPPRTKVRKPRNREETSDVVRTHRVKKSTKPSPKSDKKNNQKFLPKQDDAGPSRVKEQLPEQAETAPENDRSSQNKSVVTPLDAPRDEGSASSKGPQARPTSKANPALDNPNPLPPKRPRGRPAKAKPAANSEDASLPKRPRGRPPGKRNSAAVKGNARVTKPSQRASAPSKHKMRTRGKGTAELLQLP